MTRPLPSVAKSAVEDVKGADKPMTFIEAMRVIVGHGRGHHYLVDLELGEPGLYRARQRSADSTPALALQNGKGLEFRDAVAARPGRVSCSDGHERVADCSAVALGEDHERVGIFGPELVLGKPALPGVLGVTLGRGAEPRRDLCVVLLEGLPERFKHCELARLGSADCQISLLCHRRKRRAR